MIDPIVPFRWANHGLTAHFGMNVRITRRVGLDGEGVSGLYA
jgi:hypothetical protein